MVAATRTFPAPSTTPPPGPDGEAAAEQIKANFEFLSAAVINQVTLDAGTANAIVGTCSPALIAAPAHGQTFRLTPSANNTNAVTVDLGQGGPIALRDEDGVALGSGALVAGRPILFYKDNVAGHHRLCGPTMLGLLASLNAAIAAASWWEKLGDTTVSGPVANVEHIFTGNAYQRLLCFANGASTAVSGAFSADLRYASGSVLLGTFSGAPGASAIVNMEAKFTPDIHTVGSRTNSVILGDAPGTVVSGASANTPDRVRWSNAGGNIDAGRFVTYGLKKPA